MNRAFVAGEVVLVVSLACAPAFASPALQGPPAEPEGPSGLLKKEEGAFAGYTLISPLLSKSSHLIDMNGEIVHTWTGTNAPAGGVYLLPDGRLLRPQREEENPMFHGGGIGGRLQMLDWDGTVVWEWVLANEYQTHHHDVEPLPNGNLLLIAWEHRYAEDAVAYGRDPKAVGAAGLWPDALLEVRPIFPDDAEIVWEWHAWDHLIQDFDESKENYGSIPEHPELIDINGEHRGRAPETPEQRLAREKREREMKALGYVGGEDEEEEDPFSTGEFDADWFHTNAVDYDAQHDLIVVSIPHMCELWVIDHSTTTEEAAWHDGGRFGRGGDLLWRWGNPRMYGAGTRSDQRLFYQHNPEWVPGEKAGELRLTVFNNGSTRPEKEFSSVDELVLPFDPKTGFALAPGGAFGPAEPAWSYSEPEQFFSGFISGAQRLPNGNTLVCEGAEGRVFEVTRDGRIVWDFVNPHGGDAPATDQSGNAPKRALFRATRIAPDDPALADRL